MFRLLNSLITFTYWSLKYILLAINKGPPWQKQPFLNFRHVIGNSFLTLALLVLLMLQDKL